MSGVGYSRIGLIAVGGVFLLFTVFAFVAFLIFRGLFGGRTYSISSDAMRPALRTHDVVLVDKDAYRASAPRRGDIAMFVPPVTTANVYVKRVIGLPGETLEIRAGKVVVNGTVLPEPYVADPAAYGLAVRDYGIYVSYGEGWERLDPASANLPPRSQWSRPNTIPEHCYIVLGDSRNDSEDSHIWGCAQDSGTFATGPRAGQQASFAGRAIRIISPLNRAKDL